MATHKAGGSSKNGRNSNPQYLGLKKSGNQSVIAGNIIARQRGNKWHSGQNTGQGKDFTIFATQDGIVRFKKGYKNRTYVVVETPTK